MVSFSFSFLATAASRNMCKWDWFEDNPSTMGSPGKLAKRQRRKKTHKIKRSSRSERSEAVEATANRRWMSFNAIGSVRRRIAQALSSSD